MVRSGVGIIHISHSLSPQECRVLRNFSSLFAITSALQSSSIHRLERTWEQVSRDSFRRFQKLSEIISPENNHSRFRELLFKEDSKFASKEKKAKRGQRQSKEVVMVKDTIPYLGIFLKDLVMIDAAFQDFLDVSSQGPVVSLGLVEKVPCP
ncbi:ral guanine nucleotide dissociation stimulator-like [Thomomys bottae]